LGSLKGVGLAKRLKTLLQLPLSFVVSKLWLLALRPKVVLGVGGYASGPFVLMARLTGWLWGARVGILEQNAVPGLTNRILGAFAHRVFAAFPGLESSFSAKKLLVSGNPVREAIRFQGPPPADPFTLFVFGGSQGAQAINTWMIEALPLLRDQFAKLKIIHQTGERDFQRVKTAYDEFPVTARVEKFIFDMPECYQAASLVVCRAGSSTLSEIAAVGRPAILIPFPFATDNHQEKNARVFEQAGAAEVMVQSEGSGKKLADRIRGLMGSESSRLVEMGARSLELHRKDSAVRIVDALSR
jgi:UDP-N-acetylglucosamine--N-acetylmuramyl-(pentapeptide) pyrophosphoryl-undecaprenol N-acetylglucosamine transferase